MNGKSSKLKKETIEKRPTGTTAVFTSLLVIILHRAGVDLDADEAVTIVGALTALASIVTPRLTR